MEKTLLFCDFSEIIRKNMSEHSTIKKYQPSSHTFVDEDADIGVKANQVKVFYPLILMARAYISHKGQWPEITESMASKLKRGESCVPAEYIPLQSEHNNVVNIASSFFAANIIPNFNSGMRMRVDDEVIALVEASCTKLQRKELIAYQKTRSDSDFLAAVFIESLSHNHKHISVDPALLRKPVTDKNCKSKTTNCLHIAMISEASHMCLGGCGTQLAVPPCNESVSNSEVVYVGSGNNGVIDGFANAVVLCTHCVHKFQVWTDDEKATLLERRNTLLMTKNTPEC